MLISFEDFQKYRSQTIAQREKREIERAYSTKPENVSLNTVRIEVEARILENCHSWFSDDDIDFYTALLLEHSQRTYEVLA